jgi:protein TonB
MYLSKYNHITSQTRPETKVVKLSLEAFIPPPPSLPPEPDLPNLIEKPTLHEEILPPDLLPQPLITKPKIKRKPPKHKKRKRKNIQKRINSVVTKTAIQKQTITKTTPLPPRTPIHTQAERERFLSKIREKINQAKSYPRIAKKRHIEGIVNVSFTITKTGNIANLSIKGPKVFHTSAKRAVLNAFPIDTTNTPVTLPIDIKLKLHYQIH